MRDTKIKYLKALIAKDSKQIDKLKIELEKSTFISLQLNEAGEIQECNPRQGISISITFLNNIQDDHNDK